MRKVSLLTLLLFVFFVTSVMAQSWCVAKYTTFGVTSIEGLNYMNGFVDRSDKPGFVKAGEEGIQKGKLILIEEGKRVYLKDINSSKTVGLIIVNGKEYFVNLKSLKCSE